MRGWWLLIALLGPTVHAQENAPGESLAGKEIAYEELTQKSVTLGITVPQPLSVGYELIYSWAPNFHFFAEGGYFKLPLSGRLKSISTWSVQAGTRFFPKVDGWLYVGGALGFRQIGLGTDISNLKLDGVSLANSADLTLNAVIVGVTVGGQWHLSEKLSFNVELGVQLPIPGLHGGNTQIVQDVPDGTDLSVDDEDALERITNLPVPQIALFRLIWAL